MYKYYTIFGTSLTLKLIILLLILPEPGSLFHHYGEAALNFLQGNGFSLVYEGELIPLTLYPPGYSFIIAVLYFIFGENYIVIQLFQIIIASVSVVLFVKILTFYFVNKKTPFHIGYFYIAIPVFWFWDVEVSTGTSLGISFMIVSFYYLHLYLKSGNRIIHILLCGLFIAVATSIRSEFALFIPLFAGFLFFSEANTSKFIILYYVVGILIILTPMSIRNYNNFGTISPLPGGLGLTMVNVIGKFYPDYERGIAFGDANVLKAEGGAYTRLTYPDPYKREKERLQRSLNFIRENPQKYMLVLMKNTPRVWFGHQLHLFKDEQRETFQFYLAEGGSILQFIQKYPLRSIDMTLGILISMLLMGSAIFFMFITSYQEILEYKYYIVSFLVVFLIFIPLGVLARYTLPGYVFILPISFLGMRAMLYTLKGKIGR